MRTSINKKSDFDFIVLDNEGNAVDMPSNNFTIDLWTWGSKCRFRASSIGGVLKGCKSDNGKLRVYVDNPGFVPGKLVGEWVSYISSEEYQDGTQRTCRYISDFGIDMVDGNSTTNEQQVLAMMQYIQGASAYEIACEYGFDGTEQEWLDSLALPSVQAAKECRQLMAVFSTAETKREENEDVRIANEETRAQQESSRVTAEQQRVQAENDRALVETNREFNEQSRFTNEQHRLDNEAARVEAEKNRVANENSRVSNEALRVQAETERVEAEAERETAENGRENAEAIRERSHKRLMDAYKEFSKSEAQRDTSEADRRAAEQLRIDNETARNTAEQDRMNAEANRVTAENLRKTAEDARIANESTRQTNEQARVTAETLRESAETNRANAEAARVEAEAARAEEFATFAATLAAKEDVANKVTSIGADATDVQYPSAKAVWSAIKVGIAANVEKGEIFEIGYPDSYWIEDELISATDFSIFQDFYSGEIDDLSGNNNKLTVSGLPSIDYSTSIAGIRGGELIKNPYNSIGDSIAVSFTTPEDIDINLLTIEVYANIHASYKWNSKVIQTASNPAINNAYIFQIGVLYRLGINANTIKHWGSLGEDVLEVSHDNSFIDGALDTEIKNQYTHLVFTVNNIDKTDKLYVNSEKVLEVTNRKSLDSVANRAVTLFGNWSANIKCVRIYNKELSQEEITQNYEATKNYYAV